MCLIVDNNVAARTLTKPGDPDFGPVHDALFSTTPQVPAKLVYGGTLKREYFLSPLIRRLILLLDQAGRARQIPDTEVDAEAQALSDAGGCKSNDHHIIALARIGHARLLCSHDQLLHADFTCKSLVDNPRGKVYQTASHKHLLRTCCT